MKPIYTLTGAHFTAISSRGVRIEIKPMDENIMSRLASYCYALMHFHTTHRGDAHLSKSRNVVWRSKSQLNCSSISTVIHAQNIQIALQLAHKNRAHFCAARWHWIREYKYYRCASHAKKNASIGSDPWLRLRPMQALRHSDPAHILWHTHTQTPCAVLRYSLTLATNSQRR